MNDKVFKEILRQKGNELWRDMPWREDTRPYYVLVSELMLQQTQVSRVIPKFEAFIERFPDEKTLASASLGDVLKLWQGLGYNRRAKYLHDAARMIVNDFDGRFPENEAAILQLPGVGKNTAGAILAYAFNKPAIFVETNIRTVYIHAFFADNFAVDDKQIIAKLEATAPWCEKGKEQPEQRIYSAPGAMRTGFPAKSQILKGFSSKTVGSSHYGPRRFYQNLMDYGSYLKQTGIRNNARSRHYKKQSPLAGSVREMRGLLIKILSEGEIARSALVEQLGADARFEPALDGLVRDGLVTARDGVVHLTKT